MFLHYVVTISISNTINKNMYIALMWVSHCFMYLIYINSFSLTTIL